MPYMIKTLARFAGGVTFKNGYVTTPLCGPSRATIQTGRLVQNHGIARNRHAALRFKRLGYAKKSFGYLLHSLAGYTGGFFGKWTNAYAEVPSYRAAGYREWVGLLDFGTPLKANINGNIRKTSIPSNQEPAWLAQKIKNFVADTSSPWLAVWCPTGPHNPYRPSPAHDGDFDTEPLPDRPNFDHRDPEKPRHIRNAGALTAAEKAVMLSDWRGKLEELMDIDDALDDLFENVVDENTYVIFTSDNGYLLGEHRLYLKGRAYEESANVPFLVTGPAVREGVTSTSLVANMDIAPTLLDLAGIDPEEAAPWMDGRSIAGPLFAEGEEPIQWRQALFGEMAEAGHYDVAWRSARTETTLYVQHANDEVEYYDMALDPYQMTNRHDASRFLKQRVRLARRMRDMDGRKAGGLRNAELF